VRYRVAAGGHDVPLEKIRGRFARLWANVAEAITLADTTDVWDNSTHDGPRMVALFSDGVIVGNPQWPGWTPGELAQRWPLIG
jgi:predicted ABC-type ATPase